MLLTARGEHQDDAPTFCREFNCLSDVVEGLPARESPIRVGHVDDETLKQLNWPGEAVLDSVDFQLINRWRELLNDLARLQLVVPSMTIGRGAWARADSGELKPCSNPRSDGALVQVFSDRSRLPACNLIDFGSAD